LKACGAGVNRQCVCDRRGLPRNERCDRLEQPDQVLNSALSAPRACAEYACKQRHDKRCKQCNGDLNDRAREAYLAAFRMFDCVEQERLRESQTRPKRQARTLDRCMHEHVRSKQRVAGTDQYGGDEECQRTFQRRHDPGVMAVRGALFCERICQAMPRNRSGDDNGKPERKRPFHNR